MRKKAVRRKPTPPQVYVRPANVPSHLTDNYLQYINSPDWELKRQEAFRTHGKICTRCHEAAATDVHHKTYATFGSENVERDLTVLCRPCHEAEDSSRRSQVRHDNAFWTWCVKKYGEQEAERHYEDEFEEERFNRWLERKQREY